MFVDIVIFCPDNKSMIENKDKEKLTVRIDVRASEYEKNFIKGLAKLYAHGNVSLFMIYAALNCNRKNIDENELLNSRRRIKNEKNCV